MGGKTTGILWLLPVDAVLGIEVMMGEAYCQREGQPPFHPRVDNPLAAVIM